MQPFFWVLWFTILSLFESCSFFQKGNIDVLISDGQQPLQNAQIDLYANDGKQDSQNFILLGHFIQKDKKPISLSIDFYKYQHFKIISKSNDLNEIYLPQIKFFNAPAWWQEPKLTFEINLFKVQPHKNIPTTTTCQTPECPTEAPLAGRNDDNPSNGQWFSIQQFESNLDTDPYAPIESNKPTTPTNLSLKKEVKINIDNQKTNNPKNQIQNVKIHVSAYGKPLPNVHFWVGKIASNSLTALGENDPNGDIVIPINALSKPDSLLITKDGYLSVLQPFQNSSQDIEMKEGLNQTILAVFKAYGIDRGIEKAKIIKNKQSVDISGPLGVFILPKEESTDKVEISMENFTDSSIPIKTNNEKIQRFYTLPQTPYKPSIALLEPSMEGSLVNDTAWRRARREFFSRFMNDPSFKGLIFETVQKIANIEHKSPYELASTDWSNTWYNSLIDFFIQINEIKNNEENSLIELKIFSKNGVVIYSNQKPISLDAETTSALIYNEALEHLPFEGTAIKQKDLNFSVNLGAKQHLKKGDKFKVFSNKNAFEDYNKPLGTIVIDSVEEDKSIGIFQEKIKTPTNVFVIKSI